MPRHDPLNHRGPAIGGGKNTSGSPKKDCKNCPDGPTTKLDPKLITSVSEGERLWKHVTFGTMTCVGMCEGYMKLGLPGKPLSELRRIRDRLNTIIQTLEECDETSPPQE